MADLHPIIIPPAEHTHKTIKYTCSGEGLYKEGWLYDNHLPLPPKNPKPGQAEVEKKPVAYWKAQCAFRGLNQTGAIADLQLRLREAKKVMLPELKDAERELNKAFRKDNKIARDGSWSLLKSAEQKAKADPKKYLAEVFPKGGTGRPANLDIVVLKIGTDERFKLSEAAEKMALESVSIDAPRTGNKKSSPDRLVIIGRTRDAVWNQMREIERESAMSRQEIPKETATPRPTKKPRTTNSSDTSPKKSSQASSVGKILNPVPKAKASPAQVAKKTATPSIPAPIRTPIPASVPPPTVRKQAIGKSSPSFSTPKVAFASKISRKSAPTAQNPGLPRNAEAPTYSRDVKQETAPAPVVKPENSPFDVRGSYAIRCADIERNYEGDDLTLDIHLETHNGKPQLFGIFDFRIITGIMRFEKPIPVPKKEKTEDSFKKRKWEEDDDGDVNMADIDQYDADAHGSKIYDNKVFFLGANDKPTARRPTWRYRWRGRETGENVIGVRSDEEVSTITFSKKGSELSGVFKSDFMGTCYFTGVKVDPHPAGGYKDPETLWEEHRTRYVVW